MPLGRLISRKQAATLLATAVCGATFAVNLASAEAEQGGAPASTLNSCKCPIIPPIATSDAPANGHVWLELNDSDLQLIFSNRVQIYGSWEKAMDALAHDIDPKGTLGIAKGARPQALHPEVPLREGTLSSLLVRGSAEDISNAGDWGYIKQPEDIIEAIVRSLARVNKYGEPEIGLRDALLRVASFLVDDLASVQKQRSEDDRSRDIELYAYGSRGALWHIIGQARPRNEENLKRFAALESSRTKRMRDGLELDAFDLAYAALDVLWYVDSKGAEHRFWVTSQSSVPPPLEEDLLDITDVLLMVAAARPMFGGSISVPPNSPADAVGCKAFNVLLTLADDSTAAAAAVREELVMLFFAQGHGHSQITELSRSLGYQQGAARAVLVATNFKSAEEAQHVADELMLMALHFSELSVNAGDGNVYGTPGKTHWLRWLDETVTLMKQLMVGGRGPDSYRSGFAARLRQSWDSTNPGWKDVYRPALDRWHKDDARTMLVLAATPPCGIEPSDKPRAKVSLFARTAFGLQYIEELYYGVPTIVEATLKSPYNHPTYDLELSIGSRKLNLTAHRLDKQGRIFRTDPFVVVPEKSDKGPVWKPPDRAPGDHQ